MYFKNISLILSNILSYIFYNQLKKLILEFKFKKILFNILKLKK